MIWELPPASWTYYQLKTYCNIPIFFIRHQSPRQNLLGLTYYQLRKIGFPLLVNDAAKPASPATHRATYLVINKEKESHARGGHAEKLIE